MGFKNCVITMSGITSSGTFFLITKEKRFLIQFKWRSVPFRVIFNYLSLQIHSVSMKTKFWPLASWRTWRSCQWSIKPPQDLVLFPGFTAQKSLAWGACLGYAPSGHICSGLCNRVPRNTHRLFLQLSTFGKTLPYVVPSAAREQISSRFY